MKTQIVELEKKYWNGIENHDYETVRNLTLFPCIVAGKKGVNSIDEEEFKKMFESSRANAIKVLDIYDLKEKIIAENTAVIGYRIDFEMLDSNQEKPIRCVCTSTWIKENNKWECLMHTETEMETN